MEGHGLRSELRCATLTEEKEEIESSSLLEEDSEQISSPKEENTEVGALRAKVAHVPIKNQVTSAEKERLQARVRPTHINAHELEPGTAARARVPT